MTSPEVLREGTQGTSFVSAHVAHRPICADADDAAACMC